jgi:hypothetical protein
MKKTISIAAFVSFMLLGAGIMGFGNPLEGLFIIMASILGLFIASGGEEFSEEGIREKHESRKTNWGS